MGELSAQEWCDAEDAAFRAAHEKVTDLTILGRKIGTTIWAEIIESQQYFYHDFVPVDGLDIKVVAGGGLSFDWGTGMLETWDEFGERIDSKDVVVALQNIPRV